MTDSKAATDDVRAAIYAVLNDNVLVRHPYAPGNPERAVPVLEEVGDAEAPYIEMGASNEVADDNHSQRGALVTLTLHTWSRYRGFAEIGAIHLRLKQLLDKQAIPVPGYGWTNTYARVTSQQAMRDEDPQYRHGVTDVQVRLTQEED